MPNGFAKFLKKLQQATTRRTGQKTIRTTKKSIARGPARATGRALALTGRPSRPGGLGIRNYAVQPRKSRKAK